MNSARISLALAGLLAAVLGCGEGGAHGPQGEPVPSGPLAEKRCLWQFAVYYLPRPTAEPMAAVRSKLAGFPLLAVLEKLDKTTTGPAIHVRNEANVQEAYRPPDLASLRYFGIGVSKEQAQALQGCERALVLSFVAPGDQLWARMRDSCRLVLAVARATGGLIWDDDTRQCFSPEAWDERRLAGWEGGVPEVSQHVTIHAYKATEYTRAITLGMAKFGLPDVVVNECSWSMNRGVGNLLTVVCQRMAEGQAVGTGGAFPIDVAEVQHPQVREELRGSLKEHATGKAEVFLVKGKREEGDPDNRLAEVSFHAYPGSNVQARQLAMLSGLFGWEDTVAGVKGHDKAIEAASRRARARLPGLKKAFGEGLAPGEHIMVKAPFKTPDSGKEYMWVEIIAWDGTRIRGLLKNQPMHIPNLMGGQEVTVDEADVFDYIRRFPDGRLEGNETGKLIEKRSKTK